MHCNLDFVRYFSRGLALVKNVIAQNQETFGNLGINTPRKWMSQTALQILLQKARLAEGPMNLGFSCLGSRFKEVLEAVIKWSSNLTCGFLVGITSDFYRIMSGM